MSKLHISQATNMVAAQAQMDIRDAQKFILDNSDGQYVDESDMEKMIRKARQKKRNDEILNQAMSRDARSE